MKTQIPSCALDQMNPEALAQAAETLRTLAHPVRLRIIDLLNTTKELPVARITEYLNITQAATSQHLNHMRRVGLIQSERRGKEVWYSICDPRPIALLNCLCNCCGTKE
ncbi:MAG: winged helix-turn-helix transcriptional regulator [Pontiellaceae bacterium]|nr:winged helix-turn-helix transcriptional regulator [Pontiellaceae bacterium]